MTSLLRIEGGEIRISHGLQTHIVEIPELEVSSGSTTILLGPSGSGKSVLLKTLSGVFPTGWTQISGEIEICGRPLARDNDGDSRNRDIFYIFQDPRTYLYSRLRVRDYFELLQERSNGQEFAWSEFESSVNAAGLSHRLDTLSGKLSGGEAQRLIFVLMQLLKPSLVLGDEPLSAQDRLHHETLRGSLNKFINDEQQDRGLLLVTHEIRDIERSLLEGKTPRFYVLEEQEPHRFRMSASIDAGQINEVLQIATGGNGDQSGIDKAKTPETVRAFFRAALDLQSHYRQQESQSGNDTDILRAAALSFAWPGSGNNDALFTDLTLSTSQGKNLGVMGLSGVGKSTLAEILLRLVHGCEGDILWFGDKSLSDTEFRTRVQYVFQDCERAMAWETGTLTGALLGPLGKSRDKLTSDQENIFDEILLSLGLSHLKDKKISELSGGQLRRAYIARALFKLLADKQDSHATVLVLDEATVGLDLVSQQNLLALLDAYSSSSRYQLSLIIISHDPVVVRYLSDQLVVLHKEEGDSEGAHIVERLVGEEILRGPYRHDHTRQLMDVRGG